MHRTRVCV